MTSIVVSHGAWHTSWHYQPYADEIQAKTKIDRVTVPQLSSAGGNPPENSFEEDVRIVHKAIVSELQRGHDVLLLCHSYGGVPGPEALTDLPKPVEGKIGRVIGIVFLCAFVVERGQNLATAKLEPGKHATWVRMEAGLVYASEPIPTFYNDVKSPALAKSLVDRLVAHSPHAFGTPATHENWKDFPCYYVRCSKDRANTPPEQDFFIERLRRLNPDKTRVKELLSDHSPFVSMPERLAELTETIVDELRAGGQRNRTLLRKS